MNCNTFEKAYSWIVSQLKQHIHELYTFETAYSWTVIDLKPHIFMNCNTFETAYIHELWKFYIQYCLGVFTSCSRNFCLFMTLTHKDKLQTFLVFNFELSLKIQHYELNKNHIFFKFFFFFILWQVFMFFVSIYCETVYCWKWPNNGHKKFPIKKLKGPLITNLFKGRRRTTGQIKNISLSHQCKICF